MYLCIFPYIAKFHLLYCKELGLSEKKSEKKISYKLFMFEY